MVRKPGIALVHKVRKRRKDNSLALSTFENPVQKQRRLGNVAQGIFALEPKARRSSLWLSEDSFQNICVG